MSATANPSKKELTHQRILDAAARAIRRGGHAGASVGEVMKEAGLTHGGFYAHFGSRDEMVASAIDHAGRESGESLAASMAVLRGHGASPFRALVDAYLSPAHMAAVERGCVVAALGSEVARQPDAVRQASAERIAALARLVSSVLPAGAPPSAAMHVTSALVGALQIARALGGEDGAAVLADNRQALLAHYEPGS